MSVATKTFVHDHVLRDSAGLAVGRAILLDDSYQEGNPFPVALILIPGTLTKNVKSYVFYVDGLAYQIPQDTPAGKISFAGGVHKVNNVMLEPVSA